MIYADKTSPDLGSLAPDTVVVLPLASVEQHGAHLPVITDTALVSEVARRAEQVLTKDILLLPTLWVGSSHHHRNFPGTISLRSSTYIDVLCEMVECLLRSGFRRIMLLNGHGGNITPINEALYRLMLNCQEKVLPWVVSASYWNMPEKQDYSDFMQSPKLTHACEYETSMMLSLRVDWVKMGEAKGERTLRKSKFYDPLGYTPSRVSVSESFEQMTKIGAMGNPEKAEPEKGDRLFQIYSSALIEFLREFSRWELRKNK